MTWYRTVFLVWVVIMLAIVVPWGSFQGHAHWQNIGWVPFVSPPVRLRDMVLNALLYLPFGYWQTKTTGSQARWWRIGVNALAFSLGTEFTQVFSDERFPSATDVACNVAGAVWGNMWARR